MLDGDAGTELLGKLVFQALDVRVDAAAAFGFRRLPALHDPVHQPFRLPDGKFLLGDQARDLGLHPRVGDRQKRPRMAHLQRALAQQGAGLLAEIQQAQQVADGSPGAADGVGGVLVGELELAQQTLDRLGLLERVQVLALDVLDQRLRDDGGVRNLPHHGGHGREAGHLGGAPAALAGDDLVAGLAGRRSPLAAAGRRWAAPGPGP